MKRTNASRISLFTRGFCAVLTLTLGGLGCSPGIYGVWDGSGHVGVADRFAMEVAFQSDTRGKIRYSAPGTEAREIPMCQTRVDNNLVSFVIDPSGNTNCSTLARPLKFEGRLGAHVISGKVTANGADVGVWRAYRRPEK